jgi:hypothetical protein
MSLLAPRIKCKEPREFTRKLKPFSAAALQPVSQLRDLSNERIDLSGKKFTVRAAALTLRTASCTIKKNWLGA